MIIFHVNFFKKYNQIFRSEVPKEQEKSGWFTTTDRSTAEVDKTSKQMSTKKKRITTMKSVVTTSRRMTTTYEEDDEDDETTASTTAVAIRNEVK